MAEIYIPNGHRINQTFPFQGRQKFSQIGILGLKIYVPSGNPASGNLFKHFLQQGAAPCSQLGIISITDVAAAAATATTISISFQGGQIYLDTRYQNGGKYIKVSQHYQMDTNYIYQMSVK
jgi:hypothetical protein